MDYSFLPSLTPNAMSNALSLSFVPYVPIPGLGNATGWDNVAEYSTSQPNARANGIFQVNLTKGESYDLFSSSYFDPFILLLYDNTGKVIGADSNQGTYGLDEIFDFRPPYTGTYYVNASWDQGLAQGHRYVSVSVYEDVDAPQSETDSTFIGYDGTGGIDTFSFSGDRSSYTLSVSGKHIVITQNDGGYVHDLYDTERVVFKDVSLAFDLNGNAGKAYRLYEAAFNRTPDKAGLGYWVKSLDKGSNLESVSNSFLNSAEFKTLYGGTNTAETLVTAMYKNVLSRAPDAAGMEYWKGELSSGHLSTAGVLASFSESNENQIAVIGQIQNGIEYI